jgi:hypothetical protein
MGPEDPANLIQEPEAKPALGKKDQAQADAVTAANGTGWDMLLPTSRVQ